MSGPNGDPDVRVDDGTEGDDGDDFSGEEYSSINSMLDQINNYLDDLEDRNDSLNGKLRELLESNRQARLEFQSQLPEGREAGEDHEEDSSQRDQDVERS